MVRKLTISAAISALMAVLSAADFWATKPYASWTDKELQKLVTDSPWAWQMPIGNGNPGTSSPIVTLLWQSALPVKRAMYGPWASTDQNSKALLERAEPYYLLHMSGIPNSYRARMDIDRMKAATTLKVKGREPLHPAEVQVFEAAPTPLTPQAPPPPLVIHSLPIMVKFQAGGSAPVLVSQSTDVYFAFSKSPGVKVEDQEIEFESNAGGLPVKHKFKLKDMVYEGKLEI